MNITDSRFQIETPLPLPEDEVQLWRIDLDAIRGDESRWQKVLASDELIRAAHFHYSHDRQRYLASRGLLRIILASYLATDPNDLRFSYSKKKKPSLGPGYANTGVTFNISHSGGIALFAFTRRRDVGVDVEQVRHNSDLEAIARRFFSEHEQSQLANLPCEERVDAFFRCWTRKEAYLKAKGEGLSLPLSQFDVSLGRGEPVAPLATRPDASEAGNWLLREVPGGAGYIAALCVRGHDWKLNDWYGGLHT